jgi:L-rhamnose mutarotase
MIRRAFTMRLKEGAFPAYERHHKNVWPELVREIEKSGVASMSIFRSGDRLFVFSEVIDNKTWERLWRSDIHAKWGQVMDPLLFINPDGMIDAGELSEVYHLSTKAGKKPTVVARRPKKKVTKKSNPRKSNRR